MEHGELYQTFRHFWWLIFPIFWMIFGLVRQWSRHARANRVLDMINAYAAQGKEPPPELVRVLRDGPDEMDGKCRGDGRRHGHNWVPVFLFGGLCSGFVMLALTAGNDIGDRHGLFFVAIIMGGLCLGFLASKLSRRRDENDPQVSDPDTEAAWARGARAGSADDFATLVRLHQQALRAFLRRLTGNAAEADDLAQESFVFAWEKMDRFDPARGFRPWLFGIAWRKSRERRRGWRRLLAREAGYAQTHEMVDAADPGLALDLAAACATLAPEQRAALLLCLALDFTHAEAAEALALPLGTVKSHIARGREKLAAFLGDEA